LEKKGQNWNLLYNILSSFNIVSQKNYKYANLHGMVSNHYAYFAQFCEIAKSISRTLKPGLGAMLLTLPSPQAFF
jgi:hypothetical protein